MFDPIKQLKFKDIFSVRMNLFTTVIKRRTMIIDSICHISHFRQRIPETGAYLFDFHNYY